MATTSRALICPQLVCFSWLSSHSGNKLTHGQDRLPTVSAAQALQDLEGNDSNFVSTGLPSLDASLGSGLEDATHGGVQKGHVTEIWGPPGAGKTAFGYACVFQGRSCPLC
jgi:predicted ATP-dependent serine protease